MGVFIFLSSEFLAMSYIRQASTWNDSKAFDAVSSNDHDAALTVLKTLILYILEKSYLCSRSLCSHKE